MRRVLTPILAASLVAAPISAGAAAPASAGQPVPADARAGAEVQRGSELAGSLWIIGLVAVAVLIAILVLIDDDDEDPISP
jgi:hypothetical protein